MPMNITILANRDIASNLALNLLVGKLGEHRLRIFLSEKVGGGRALAPELGELKFFEQTLFNRLLFPLIDNQSSAVNSRLRGFEGLGEAVGYPATPLNHINTPEGLALLEAGQPDLIISIRYGVILKSEAIALPRYGVLNLHSGLLPQYQGVMASFRAMLNGDREIGATLHYIVDSGIDTGPIVAQSKITVERQRSYLWHVLQLYPGGCEMIADAVREIAERGEVSRCAQAGSSRYYSFPTASELQEFERSGFKLFDPEEIVAFALNYIDSPEARYGRDEEET